MCQMEWRCVLTVHLLVTICWLAAGNNGPACKDCSFCVLMASVCQGMHLLAHRLCCGGDYTFSAYTASFYAQFWRRRASAYVAC